MTVGDPALIYHLPLLQHHHDLPKVPPRLVFFGDDSVIK